MPPAANLVKWWAKKGHEVNRVTRHLSPHQQNPVKTLIESIPYKTVRKVKENGAVIIPCALLLVGTIKWGVAANDEDHRKHWS